MNLLSKSVLLALSLGFLGLTSCKDRDVTMGSKVEKEEPKKNEGNGDTQGKKEEGSDNKPATYVVYQPTDATPIDQVNETEATKVVVKMYQGHLHPPTNQPSLHYVPLKLIDGAAPELGWDQKITFEYKNGKWEIASDSQKGFFLEQTDATMELPAPVYACWVEYYDASGKIINGNFTTAGEYQTFFIPQHTQAIISGELDDTDKDANSLVRYSYKDTEKWNESATGKGKTTTFRPATDPIGLKGFFMFPKANRKMDLNLQLYKTTKGKLTDGKASIFTQPSEMVQLGGKKVISLAIPIHVFKSIEKYYSDMYEDDREEEFPSITLDMFKDTPYYATAEYITRITGREFNSLFNSYYSSRYGEGISSEEGGVWF